MGDADVVRVARSQHLDCGRAPRRALLARVDHPDAALREDALDEHAADSPAPSSDSGKAARGMTPDASAQSGGAFIALAAFIRAFDEVSPGV